jgi:hypothetical protein
MSEKIEHVLAQSIDDITAGRASLEDVLKQHPGLRNELEPLLRLALGLREASNQVGPSLAFRSKAKAQLMEAISAQSPRRGLLHLPLGNIWKGERRQGMVFKIATAMAALLVMLGIGGGTVYAAQDAQFGDLLYPVKTATEQARLVLSTTASGKAASHLDIAQSRLDELTNATVNGKSDVAHMLATQYRSHVMEALAWAAQASDNWAAQASDNRSERATIRLQERLEAHQRAMEALGQEMPDIAEGKGQGKPDDVGKPEGVGKPEDVGNAEEAGRATAGECVYVQTGSQNRYQVWCNGVHVIVNTDDIVNWLTTNHLSANAQAAANDDEAASAQLIALESNNAVEHFNFYGPLSHLNQEIAPGVQEEEQGQGGGQGQGKGPKSK